MPVSGVGSLMLTIRRIINITPIINNIELNTISRTYCFSLNFLNSYNDVKMEVTRIT